MVKTYITYTKLFLLVILLTFGTIFVEAQWAEPTAEAPGDNTAAPVNVGTTDQIKDGGLGINALAVFGNAILSGVSRYLNFGTTAGDTGYGIRDNAGVMEYKNENESWIPLTPIAFSVHKNNVDQSIPGNITWTKVTWATELFDTNNNFANNRFTPTVPGKYLVNAQIYMADLIDPLSGVGLAIYKNGVVIQDIYEYTYSTTQRPMPAITAIVDMNGTTDYLEVYTEHTNGGARALSGMQTRSTFSGSLLR